MQPSEESTVIIILAAGWYARKRKTLELLQIFLKNLKIIYFPPQLFPWVHFHLQ